MYTVQPKMYTRFVDDIFLVYDCTQFNLQEFLELFNDQHPDINLTVEHETNKELPYLDVRIKRVDPIQGLEQKENEDQIHSTLSLSIHRKSAHSDKYLHFRSSNPVSLKRNVFQGLSLRG